MLIKPSNLILIQPAEMEEMKIVFVTNFRSQEDWKSTHQEFFRDQNIPLFARCKEHLTSLQTP